MILRTFRSAFPYMSVVRDPRHSGTYLLGSQAPITFSRPAIRAVFGSPAARADLQGAPDYPARSTAQWVSIISGSVWLTDNQVNAYTGPGPLITDDHPLTEYFMLDGLGSDTARPTLFVHRLWPGRQRTARPAHHRCRSRLGIAEADPGCDVTGGPRPGRRPDAVSADRTCG